MKEFLKQSPERTTLIMIGLLMLWSFIIAGKVNLSVDEAHYALYGAKLDWSYFDHPPMVGWLNSISIIFSTSDFALRVLPIIFFAISNILLYKIAARLYPEFKWVGFWSVALVNASIMFQLLSLSMLPDTPIMIAALMVFWHMLNLRETNNPSLKDWLWLGFWLGISALSKYTAITLVFSLMLILLFEKRFIWLKAKGLWLAMLLTLVMITPIIYWNYQHDWISFVYQMNHGTYHDEWSLLRFSQSQLAQFGVYSPLLYLVGIILAFSAIFKNSPTRLLALFSLPVIILFAMGSGYKMSLPHWTQLAWLFIAPAVVFWVWQNWQKKWLRISTYINGALMLGLTFVLNSQIVTPWLPFAEKQNFIQELTGWQQAIKKAKLYQKKHSNAPLFAANWTQASRIAWYAYPQPVYVTDNRFDQFDLWFGNPPKNSSGILILPSYGADQPRTGGAGHFQSCKALDDLVIKNNEIIIVRYRFFYCQNFQPVNYGGWAAKLPIVQEIENRQ